MVFLGAISVMIHLILFFLDPSYYNVMLFIRYLEKCIAPLIDQPFALSIECSSDSSNDPLIDLAIDP